MRVAPRGHKLLTADIRKKLLKNGEEDNNEKCVVKFFSPYGRGTWLISSAEVWDNGDLCLYGLADIGQGYVEFGTVLLSELEKLTIRMGGFYLPAIERDCGFKPSFTMQEYYNRSGDSGHQSLMGVA
jgi:hypothetical protein